MVDRRRLDEDGCLDLLSILRVVNQIDQEQAWAICYEVCSLMKRLAAREDTDNSDGGGDGSNANNSNSNSNSNGNSNGSKSKKKSRRCAPIESLGQVHLHKDGHVHEKTCKPSDLSEDSGLETAATERELVASLGLTLFRALDYGIPDDQERKLGITMEYLIYQSQSKLSLEQVLELCEKRLPAATRADSHYSGLCKSLVQDSIQLSIFLEKIYTASMVLSDISDRELSELGEPLASLRALKIDDWARLWMQVIKDLKQALAIT